MNEHRTAWSWEAFFLRGASSGPRRARQGNTDPRGPASPRPPSTELSGQPPYAADRALNSSRPANPSVPRPWPTAAGCARGPATRAATPRGSLGAWQGYALRGRRLQRVPAASEEHLVGPHHHTLACAHQAEPWRRGRLHAVGEALQVKLVRHRANTSATSQAAPRGPTLQTSPSAVPSHFGPPYPEAALLHHCPGHPVAEALVQSCTATGLVLSSQAAMVKSPQFWNEPLWPRAEHALGQQQLVLLKATFCQVCLEALNISLKIFLKSSTCCYPKIYKPLYFQIQTEIL